MGHNRAEVRRLSVLAVREAGARSRKSGPVPVRLPGGSAVLASQLSEIGLFGLADGRAPGAHRTEPVIVPYVF